MFTSTLVLVLGLAQASAMITRDSGCSLHLSVNEDLAVGQLSSGQVRTTSLRAATFILKDGTLLDSQGRGCWWTPPSYVLQCDEGQTPDDGFEVGCDGVVSFKGESTFYECEAGNEGQYNIYLEAKGANCNTTSLYADSCQTDCTDDSPTQTEGCPANLKGAYEFPHLIIPVNRSEPNEAPGTSYFGEISSTVSSTISSIFNFDIVQEDAGKTCTLIFLFPKQADLETSSFTYSGNGVLEISKLESPAENSTTWNNKPKKEEDYGELSVAPGNSYSIATFDCPAGSTIAFEIDGDQNTYLKYFQDYNPSPIGLYIRKC